MCIQWQQAKSQCQMIKTAYQSHKTMADKLMYIPKDDKQNYPICRLKSVIETFEHSTQ